MDKSSRDCLKIAMYSFADVIFISHFCLITPVGPRNQFPSTFTHFLPPSPIFIHFYPFSSIFIHHHPFLFDKPSWRHAIWFCVARCRVCVAPFLSLLFLTRDTETKSRERESNLLSGLPRKSADGQLPKFVAILSPQKVSRASLSPYQSLFLRHKIERNWEQFNWIQTCFGHFHHHHQEI